MDLRRYETNGYSCATVDVEGALEGEVTAFVSEGNVESVKILFKRDDKAYENPKTEPFTFDPVVKPEVPPE